MQIAVTRHSFHREDTNQRNLSDNNAEKKLKMYKFRKKNDFCIIKKIFYNGEFSDFKSGGEKICYGCTVFS